MFTKEKIKDLHYSVTGTIAASDLQAAADEILLEYGKKAKMPGFRTGKIPLSILRQKYNVSAYGEAIDKLMNQDLNNYIADKKIRLAGAPKADLAGWEIGKDTIPLRKLKLLSDYLKISIDYIVGLSEENNYTESKENEISLLRLKEQELDAFKNSRIYKIFYRRRYNEK